MKGSAVYKHDLDFDSTLVKVRNQLASRGARTVAGLARTFRQIDSLDGNKRVDQGELYTGLNEAGCNVTKEEVACLMQRFDTDGSGDLTFDEFLVGIRGFLSPARQAVVD